MQKIIINHLQGSQASKTDIIEASETEYLLGRDESCRIRFNPEQDDLVSRVHCKIMVNEGDQFFLTDLNSRNGTFVNDKQISAATKLASGDNIQLGKGGPVFSFDLDPKLLASKHTRLAEANDAVHNTSVFDRHATLEAPSKLLSSPKIIIKHLSGSKSKQTEFINSSDADISFGRDFSCQIVFDAEQESLVSRRHCMITMNKEGLFCLTDLNSRNGTYLNAQKIVVPTEIKAGDTVQLGKDGPKFSFDLDIKPQATQLNTRYDMTENQGFKPSKDTMLRLINQAEYALHKRFINWGVGMLGLVSLAMAYMAYQHHQNSQALHKTETLVESVVKDDESFKNTLKPVSASDIFTQYGKSSVLIEASWKLIHTTSGKQIFQKYDCLSKQGKCISPKVPVYIKNNGVVEPYLDTAGVPIGESLTGSGFVVNEDGYIMTNRHVAASWHDQGYHFKFPGILVDCIDEACAKFRVEKLDEKSNPDYLASLNQWIPSKAKMLGQRPLNGKIVEGRNDYLEVTFPESELRIPAHLVRTSETADVAMIKIDIPQKLQTVQLSVDPKVTPGNDVTVMGYPGISPETLVKLNPHSQRSSEGEVRTIPKPTVTKGNIGKVITDAKVKSEDVSELYSSMGDVYQLTVNATGPGNSGGPVFDDKGQVIGLFTYGKRDAFGTLISFAVPIKYGRELMDITTIR